MCQVVECYLSCTHNERYRLINPCPFGFASSCKGKNNQIIAYRRVYTPLWCGPCSRQRHDTILAVHQLYTDEVHAQAEREGWSNRAIERAMRRCHQQEDKEIQSFLVAVEEAESRNARLHGARRGQHNGDSNEEEYEGEGGSEDNEDNDIDESDSESARASNLVTTSCGQQDYINIDDESSCSDSEGPPSRMLNYQRFPSNEGRMSHHGGFPGANNILDESIPQGMSDAE